MKIQDLNELNKMGYLVLDGEIAVINKVEEVLKERGLEQVDLAKMTGLSRQYINSVIKGNIRPGVDSAIKISYVLDMAVEELFNLKESAWTSDIKDTGEETLFLDICEMEIIGKKVMEHQIKKESEELSSSSGYIYVDTETDKKLTKEVYESLLNDFIEERIHKEIEEVKNSLERGMSKKAVESRARKQIQTEFDKRYTERYKKLAKIVTPLVNKQNR
ncbi:helix-turn-helix transcriptional regulator [Bacillus sp. NPDC094106]|uniref:helix-turn-helix transcriptional regulator n=1 Tax=Bacillus sp. NPDC094106 TaxID=3363949 RepID=UPI0037F61C44